MAPGTRRIYRDSFQALFLGYLENQDRGSRIEDRESGISDLKYSIHFFMMKSAMKKNTCAENFQYELHAEKNYFFNCFDKYCGEQQTAFFLIMLIGKFMLSAL